MLRSIVLLASLHAATAYALGGVGVAATVRSCWRHAPARCQEETLPEAAAAAIPPEQLADAWVREDKARELAETLKGCSIYILGFGSRKSAVGRILARRLKTYRHYDVTALVCSTYKAITQSEDDVSLEALYAAEPLSDIEMLSQSVVQQVQQNMRSIFTVWEGSVSASDFMVMQQGIVVHLEGDESPWAEMPAETKEAFAAGHAKADVTVAVGADAATDDVVFQLVQDVLAFVEANPAKSKGWKEEAERKLAEQDDA